MDACAPEKKNLGIRGPMSRFRWNDLYVHARFRAVGLFSACADDAGHVESAGFL